MSKNIMPTLIQITQVDLTFDNNIVYIVSKSILRHCIFKDVPPFQCTASQEF